MRMPDRPACCVLLSINHTGSPAEGIVVTLIQDPESSVPAYKTLCLSINPTPSQQIQNIQIVFNPTPPQACAPPSPHHTMDHFPREKNRRMDHGTHPPDRRENMDFVQSMPPSFANR